MGDTLKEREEKLRAEIMEKVCEYYHLVHEPSQREPFDPGRTKIRYAGRVFDEREMCALTSAALDFWLTYGKECDAFERGLEQYLGVRRALFVNSGSSANLLAFLVLTSPLLGERAVRRGDEIITVAAGFPTTVAPAVQFGAVPVFIDVKDSTANIDPALLEQAWSPRSKAVMIAHTLGNPFALDEVTAFCRKHHLYLVEDNCDALGSLYRGKPTGTFGDIGTSSFYPAHHLTTGEGGAVYTNDPLLARIAQSIRDWGRDCTCHAGCDNTCGKRFTGQFGTLPRGYDHKYVYSHFGCNFKATDLQAAIGRVQLEKFPVFAEKRRKNHAFLKLALSSVPHILLPETEKEADPSPFGFLVRTKKDAPFTRDGMVEYLEMNGIQTRPLFAGNLTRHPCFDALENGVDYRIASPLENTDYLMNAAFWIGVYPGMDEKKLQFMADKIAEYAKKHGGLKVR